MIRLKISTKILFYFLLVSLLPLSVATFILVSSANSQLLTAAGAKQQAVADDLADSVNYYLSSKIDNLDHLSQLYSTGTLSPADIDQNIAVTLNDDPDMQRVAFVNASGEDQVVFNRSGRVSTLENESNTDAFKAVGYLGRDFVSSVSYDSSHNPIITIATPILQSNFSQYLSNLSKANFGTYQSSSDIEGVVIASYNMSNLWKSVLSTKVGQGGYAYVVDSLGNLVAYPNSQFLATHPKLSNVQAVKNIIAGKLTTGKTISETGKVVISTPRLITVSDGWAIIVEEPTASVYANVNSYIKLATIIGLTGIGFSVVLSFFFRRQLTEPIKKLSSGAQMFGRGEFDQAIVVNTKDELHDLAETFNTMGRSIKQLVGDLRTNNNSLMIEQTKLNDIISSVSDGVIALNNKGEIVSANPPAAKLIGKTVDEIKSKKITDLYKLEYEDKPFMPNITKAGTYHFGDLTLHNGTSISYLDIVVSVLDHKDSDVAAIITVRDQTKSRELDFMKLDFVAIAAHELRTPLTVVRGYLDLLNAEATAKFTINSLENLQKAVEGTNQLRDLISKLLNIARIERGEMEIFIEKMNLTKLVKESVRQHDSQAAQKEHRLSFSPTSDKTIFVPADPSSITEVLNNLIGNAIKYTPKGGIITVRLGADDNEAKVEVTDNGPGIPKELSGKLFTKFYRAERSLIAGSRGTGLGLYISKTIIELQHGKIGLEDLNTKGSTFFFSLPLYKPEEHDKLIAKGKQLGGIHGWFKKHSDR